MVFDQEYLKGELTEEIRVLWENTRGREIDFLRLYTPEEKKRNEEWIRGQSEQIQEKTASFPKSKKLRREWCREVEALVFAALSTEPIVGIHRAMDEAVASGFMIHMKELIRRIGDFDREMPIGDMGQAFRNYLVYGVFRELNGLPQRCTPAIFGYSMLYPYTDNFLDETGITEEQKEKYNCLIGKKLRNEPISRNALTKHEKNTLKLLEQIECSYQRDGEEEIYTGLLLMLEAQAASQRQCGQCGKTESLTGEDILGISIYKGGLSVLIDRYLIDLPMTEPDIRFYYGFGFLLQLCDDLQDIGEDKKSGSRTCLSDCGNEEDTGRQVKRILCYVRDIFEDCRAKRQEFKEFLLTCSYLLILFSAAGSREHLGEEVVVWLEERLPFTLAFLDEIKGFGKSKALLKDQKKVRQLLYCFADE